MSMVRTVGAPHRRQVLWWAFLMHRVSGVLLALFLPFHFLVLGFAIKGDATLDGFLAWTENPLVKLAETGLFLLLAVHLAGGLRLLALELLAWRSWQKNMAALAAGAALAGALLFLGVAW
ncbi:succinate dehydrogenase [Marivibrio halodurans]|nr:succinate dehydrogenase [Marivibrio halodurans]